MHKKTAIGIFTFVAWLHEALRNAREYLLYLARESIGLFRIDKQLLQITQ